MRKGGMFEWVIFFKKYKKKIIIFFFLYNFFIFLKFLEILFLGI